MSNPTAIWTETSDRLRVLSARCQGRIAVFLRGLWRHNRRMITRHHLKDDAHSVAEYSDCERYRYTLTRVWNPDGDRALFVMLNPSTATEVQNDPTV